MLRVQIGVAKGVVRHVGGSTTCWSNFASVHMQARALLATLLFTNNQLDFNELTTDTE